jgi:RES domain-containing protein
MLADNALLAVLEEAPTESFHGAAFRLIGHQHAKNALSAVGSLRHGGRYNIAGAFEALYLADNPVTALHETQIVLHTEGRLAGVKGPPRLLLSVECVLDHVLDLTNAAIQDALGTSLAELIAPWLPFVGRTPAAPTQELGAAAYATGRISALRAPSARVREATNLVLFPDRLREGESIAVFDDTGTFQARLEGV